jgi:uncharacterized lipoprotein YbaY/membrane-bound inhibitor of C-type lysozyme
VTLFRYSFCFLIVFFLHDGIAQNNSPWQRLEYACANEILITQIIATPEQITLIFNDAFYPMKQVSATRYESDATLSWSVEEGVGRLEEADGIALAEGCTTQNGTTQSATPTPVNYTCKDNVSVYIQYVNDVATISVTHPTYGTQTFELPKVTSASGAKFSNGSTTWFVQGEEGNLFEEAEEVQHAEKCKLLARASAMKTLTGTVTYLPRVALPENAVVQVQLQDVSMQDVAATVLAEQIIETNAQQIPIPFALSYDEGVLEPNRSYALSVRITVDDELYWINTAQVRVLGEGYPSDNVEVRVERVQ